MHDPKDPNSLINNKVNAILEDSKGNLWVGTAEDGLHIMDRATGKFQRHLYDPAYPEKLSRPPVNKF
jgi:ligand-binding sensor domain-containing protein